MRALRFLLRKEFLQIFRDHVILGMLFVMPLGQLLILANAATFEVRSARLYVVDHDHTPMSRGLTDRLAASGRFVPTAASPSSARADQAMLARQTDAILVIPTGFERELVRQRRAEVQFILNAEDGAAAGVLQSYAGRIFAAYSAELSAQVTPTLASIGARVDLPPRRGEPIIEIRRRGWYNPELDYLDFMVPGILVVLVTVVGTLLTAMNIVREKEAGTLDQLNVTPIRRSTFVAAKLIPLWSLALLDLALGLALAHFAFGVPVRGSLALVFVAAAIYLLMSGLFTPVRGMPVWAQWAAQLNPVTHFIRLMRAVLLKGAGPAEVAPQLAMLAVIGAVVLTLAVRQYRKRAA
jgi:ABC-2 type transport system permease protein